MKNLEKLDNLFNLDPTVEKDTPVVVPENISPSKEMDIEQDYALARTTLRDMLVKGTSTLDTLMDFAKNSETPRSYEVAGQFIKTISDVSKDLLELQKRTKELQQTETSGPRIGTQNNVVFAGSTNELMKFIKNNNNDNDRIIDQ